MENCELCRSLRSREDIIVENDYSFCKWDKYRVSPGHMLIIPKSHVNSFFSLSGTEVLSLYELLKRGKDIIDKQYNPDGYNVGVNIGRHAGQTIFHLHIHLIPRYRGDVKDPEGGVRNVIPGMGKYGDKIS